ncbi:hypothetical protein SBRY_70309 [Actinacidiphila bryophytorum]|uniref:Uncharacterized protein n=1 Tax=Actinacidiphila bryophytorum TaxID=1436133 RepID=A0A9W4H6L4_9ACTN|nr:hypothetical protein SBRY_70309 [Actinacidiphila bryophytorum]
MGTRRPGGRHPRGDPGQQLRRRLPGRHRRLPRARRLRPGHHGLGAQRRPDGAGGRGVRQPRQDLRDPGHRHRPGRRRHRPGGPGAGRQRGRRLPHVPDQGHPDPRLGQARRHPRPRHRQPRGLLAGRGPRARRQPDRQGHAVPARARHRGPADRDHGPAVRDRVLAGADPPRRGHRLGDRQRAARLPDRPLPDPGAGHQRQDALGGPADQRWRPVRDRGRRLGAQARAAAGQGELPALGQPGRVLRAGRQLRAPGRLHGQRAGADPRRHPGPRHRHLPQRGPLAQPPPRRHRQPRQPLLPRDVLGAGAGRADRGRGARGGVRGAREDPHRAAGRHRYRIDRCPGIARRHRRLLPARPRQGGRRDAPLGDVQPGHRLAGLIDARGAGAAKPPPPRPVRHRAGAAASQPVTGPTIYFLTCGPGAELTHPHLGRVVAALSGEAPPQ